MFNGEKKDHWFAGVAGLTTAAFVSIIFMLSDAQLRIGSYDVPLWVLFFVLPIGEAIGYALLSHVFSKIHGLRQIGRYSIVGVMNFSVDTGLLLILSAVTGIYEGILIALLNMVSATLAIINSYFWNRTWTFARRAAPHTREFIAFVVIMLFGLVINSTIVYILTTYVSLGEAVSPERLLILAKIISALIAVLWNFFGYKFFVFHTHEEPIV